MRRFTLAAGIACAILLMNQAGAQNSTMTPGGTATATTTSTGGNGMPGQVVGGYRGQVFPVGNKLPSAAPQAGQSVAGNAFQRPYDPVHPFDALKGTSLNPNQVIAPLIGADGKPVQPPDKLDLISENIRAFFAHNPPPPRPPYTPGIAPHEGADPTDVAAGLMRRLGHSLLGFLSVIAPLIVSFCFNLASTVVPPASMVMVPAISISAFESVIRPVLVSNLYVPVNFSVFRSSLLILNGNPAPASSAFSAATSPLIATVATSPFTPSSRTRVLHLRGPERAPKAILSERFHFSPTATALFGANRNV